MKQNCLIIDRWRWDETQNLNPPLYLMMMLDFFGIREGDGSITWVKHREKGPHYEHYDD